MQANKDLPPLQSTSNLRDRTFDYTNVVELRRFLTATGRIRPRKMTGLSAKGQRNLAQAVKRARIMALLPFIIRPKANFNHFSK